MKLLQANRNPITSVRKLHHKNNLESLSTSITKNNKLDDISHDEEHIYVSEYTHTHTKLRVSNGKASIT